MRKLLSWAAIIFVVYYLATQPAAAAGLVHQAFGWLQQAGNSLATFANSL
jgi:hypothetical protein